MVSAQDELQALHRERRALLVQAPWIVASAVGLVVGAGALVDAPLDLQFLLLAGAGVFSLAAVHWVDELCTLLSRECPRCAEPFFGDGKAAPPWPLRRRCSHCRIALPGTPNTPDAPPTPPTRDLG